NGLYKNEKTKICISTTGIAGPNGGTKLKPVGLVYIGIKINNKNYIFKKIYKGNRLDIQRRTRDFIFRKINELIRKVEENTNDHQARLDLSLYYNSIGNKIEAADLLIESIKLNREWNEKAAQNQLLKFFEVWGFTDQVSIDKRKSLSSILFS
ncbi:MAG: tetratricopeptide repeat protein, partial [Hyphomicrobiales bacterium]